ncbi:hypothetical protein SISNIDRAFT_485319 [Sistotremastrum niveocremeum HHB9708]|uniref:Uncharacterized protein n=1 Tax=Sistotremastrum niveocremeum HHB9708 TaxID=1314777 RepID=A0A164V0N3_9AGAM|nr:hypothetical protein SISNIDRAFT_485319 [Sistotremastrum niveocremeum HHB9708]
MPHNVSGGRLTDDTEDTDISSVTNTVGSITVPAISSEDETEAISSFLFSDIAIKSLLCGPCLSTLSGLLSESSSPITTTNSTTTDESDAENDEILSDDEDLNSDILAEKGEKWLGSVHVGLFDDDDDKEQRPSIVSQILEELDRMRSTANRAQSSSFLRRPEVPVRSDADDEFVPSKFPVPPSDHPGSQMDATRALIISFLMDPHPAKHFICPQCIEFLEKHTHGLCDRLPLRTGSDERKLRTNILKWTPFFDPLWTPPRLSLGSSCPYRFSCLTSSKQIPFCTVMLSLYHRFVSN